MKNYKRSELAKEILKGLAIGGFIVACFALPGLAQVATLFKPKGAYDRHRVGQAIHGLEKKKWVRVYQKNGEDVVEITERGKQKVLEYNLETMKLKPQKKWDRVWRMVMFDIPETKKAEREWLRWHLKKFDYLMLQKSVWVGPSPLPKEFLNYVERIGIKDGFKTFKLAKNYVFLADSITDKVCILRV